MLKKEVTAFCSEANYLKTWNVSDLLFKYKRYMYLKLFVDSEDDELKQKYSDLIAEHNSKTSLDHIDAGFDLFCPDDKRFTSTNVNKLDYQIICAAHMVQYDENMSYNCTMNTTGFYMYPRSSISKTHLRLANNTGIIDAGYRGHLIGMFDVVYANEVSVHKLDRHLQICAPGLVPILVKLVQSREELGGETVRGEGGFGSTGK